jgi:hypothetical protein
LIFVGFNMISITIEKFNVSVQIFSCLCCYCISIYSCSSREGARVPLCSTSNSRGEIWGGSWGDICGSFSSTEGNFDVMIIQGGKLELCYNSVQDHECNSPTQSTCVQGASCYSTTGQGFRVRQSFMPQGLG